jgi:hypothetical protein
MDLVVVSNAERSTTAFILPACHRLRSTKGEVFPAISRRIDGLEVLFLGATLSIETEVDFLAVSCAEGDTSICTIPGDYRLKSADLGSSLLWMFLLHPSVQYPEFADLVVLCCFMGMVAREAIDTRCISFSSRSQKPSGLPTSITLRKTESFKSSAFGRRSGMTFGLF